MKARDIVRARGHPLVQGTHPTTFEVTRDETLTLSGDCIIGIAADKGAADLDPGLRALLRDDRAVLTTRLVAGGQTVVVRSQGSAAFTLDHPADLVWRRSDFVSDRTVGIRSDHVAAALPREFIEALRRGEELVVELEAEIPEGT
ncbi:DUF371 domain-containing protein [Methanoculleus bourgensis]|jgi:hypothetical protein|uniref:DUF371 domain-containing protein n=1 Tax=Methanoculleus bourgensis TaxID=83986 RepID=A0A7K4C4E2_9EURY|nr:MULTISPECIES: DUF371 domain-containing protein [Methanoculleus]MBT0731916.1 DUF371 domain-containing protein [Methanoculleus bourgensis]MDD3372518.1 DUF371 domain-containing protein [Methanoculleus bourgensis]NMA88875.1 DUF371 domain-containing protein [Methanoculleus bourgensis]NQS77433.1 DUF371 domain-containing protein [Methanoculleus bourgensis]